MHWWYSWSVEAHAFVLFGAWGLFCLLLCVLGVQRRGLNAFLALGLVGAAVGVSSARELTRYWDGLQHRRELSQQARAETRILHYVLLKCEAVHE